MGISLSTNIYFTCSLSPFYLNVMCACSVVSDSLLRPRGLYITHQAPVYGIFQARILEWVAFSSSRGSSQIRDETCISYVSCTGRWILYHCASWEAQCHVTWTQCLILSRLIKLKGTLIWHEFYVLLLPKPPPTQRKEGKQAGRQEKKSSRCANEKLRYLFKNFAICMNYLFQSFLGSWFHRIVGV